MTSDRLVKYWLPVILWLGFTFLMSTKTFSAENTSRIIEPIVRFLFPSISHHGMILVHEIIRKLAHVTEYFILGILLFRAFKGSLASPHSLRWAALSLLILVVAASGDEFHQMFVPGRTPSIIDVGIDSFGGFLAQCVSVAWFRFRQRHPRTTE